MPNSDDAPNLTDCNVFQPPFSLLEPDSVRAGIIFNSPHSGNIYPADFLQQVRLDLWTLRASEDCFVDELFSGAVDQGLPLLRAHFPRSYVDLNREAYELDPSMFMERLPSYVNSRSARVAGGLGTIARIVADQKDIYDKRLPVAEALNRIEMLYKPYHRLLQRLLNRTHAQFGAALLIDCHSMPAIAVMRDGDTRGDIVLGDRYGTTCAPQIINAVDDFLSARNYRVLRNKPYAGGFITEHYGSPLTGYHSLQIEVSRALYMDERTYRKTRSFQRLREDLSQMAAMLTTLPLEQMAQRRTAAE